MEVTIDNDRTRKGFFFYNCSVEQRNINQSTTVFGRIGHFWFLGLL